jgi:hypothetical protein
VFLTVKRKKEIKMVIINKILSALIFLLAIAACIAAVLLHERRIELRDRADSLAQVLDRVAIIADGNGETSTELNASEKVNTVELGWEKHHHDLKNNYQSWKNNAKTIETNLESLSSMKIDLADALLKVSENLEYDKPKDVRTSLNSVHTFSTFTEQITVQAGKVRARDDRLAQALVQVSMAIKKVQEQNGFKSLADKNNNNVDLEENVSSLISNAGKLFGRAQILASGLNDLNTAFTADLDGEILFKPKWSGTDFQSESVEDINKAFAVLRTDLKTLNGELYKLKVANNMIEGQRQTLVRQTDTIEELNNENDKLKNINGTLSAQITRLEKQIAANKPPEGISHKHVDAKVVEVNDRFNFIVINRGSSDGLVLQAKMVVHEEGRFVCRVKATKVFENSAICEILNRPVVNPLSDKELIPNLGASAMTVND